MANNDTPLGGVPIKHRNGAPYNGACNAYYLPAAYDQAMFIGDAVLITGTSNTALYKGNEPGTLPEINLATAGSTTYLTGFIVGFDVDADDLTKTYNTAKNERIAYVADDPDLVFEIQEDGGGTVLDATDVGNNALLVYTHAGSTLNGKSGAELDRSSAATTATHKLKILRLVNRSDNALGDSAKWEIMINLHSQRYTTGL
jgi:hypothetical protein